MTQTRTRLEEDINKKTSKDTSWIFFVVGVIVGAIGYFFYDFHINYYITQTGKVIRSEYPYQLIGLVLIIAGVCVILVGLIKRLNLRSRMYVF